MRSWTVLPTVTGSRFVAFSSKVRDARMCRDTRTGEPVQVTPERHLHFKLSKLLLKQMSDLPAPE
ncbi:HU family DNA-binding protein [Paracoccus sp. PAMC 22219]|uniref:HU family DNA-binding protein n=1 Tax=Paracoccus sp. PAMC 22219 TaxID=1569209 RepID=UPI0009DD6CCA